ncbi:MAG: sugar kinase [Paracoccaceae bacterium]
MMQLLCIGEAMAELRKGSDGFAVGFAGDTFNTAVYCRRLLPAAMKVGFLTRIGTDPLSSGFLALAEAENIDATSIRRDPSHNFGIYSVQTDASGERSFHYWRNDSAARKMFQADEDFGALSQAGIVYLSAITLAIIAPAAREALLSHLAGLRAKGIRIAFDSNYRPRLWQDAATARDWISRMWRMTDIALPSADDERALFGDADDAAVLARLRDAGCRAGALKCGESGPRAIAEGVPTGHFPAATHVLDTTAAGDSFNGAFLAALILDRDEKTAMHWGHQMASAVIGQPGAIVPNTPQLQDSRHASQY